MPGDPLGVAAEDGIMAAGEGRQSTEYNITIIHFIFYFQTQQEPKLRSSPVPQ